MTRRRKPRSPIWRSVSILTLTCERSSGLALLVSVEPESHIVVAVEAEVPRGSALHGVNAIFDNHAHKVVGQGATLSDAIEMAECYAAAWLRSDEAAAACMCDEIGKIVS